jgi:hypothetical protein
VTERGVPEPASGCTEHSPQGAQELIEADRLEPLGGEPRTMRIETLRVQDSKIAAAASAA